MTKFRAYQEVSLVAPEATVMEELEVQLGQAIPHFDEGDDIEFGFITEHTHVIKLFITAQDLSSLPASIGSLDHLRVLILEYNGLESVPDTIGQLRSLQELNLRENQLSSVPDSIGQPQNLQELDLYRNLLDHLPSMVTLLKLAQGNEHLKKWVFIQVTKTYDICYIDS